MEDAEKPVHAPKRRIRVTDVLIALLFLLVCLFLAKALISQLSLRHEVSAAKEVTDQMVHDIRAQDAASARNLGSKAFQDENSLQNLSAQLKVVSSHIKGTPTVDRQTVNNDKYGQAVAIIYKYPSKPAFYIRVIATKPKSASSWHVTDINGSPDEKSLIID